MKRKLVACSLSESLRWCNRDVKPQRWFSNRGTKKWGPSEETESVSGELHIRRRTQRCHLHSKTTCSWVSSSGPTFLPPRHQRRTVSQQCWFMCWVFFLFFFVVIKHSLPYFYGSNHWIFSLFLLRSFIKGLPIKSVSLPDELKQSIGLQPMQNGISYVISTKVRIVTLFSSFIKYTPLLTLTSIVTGQRPNFDILTMISLFW